MSRGHPVARVCHAAALASGLGTALSCAVASGGQLALRASANRHVVAAGAPRPERRAVRTSAPALIVGRSVEGRVLRAIRIGAGHGPAVLVFGAIHGDEPAGVAVARDLLADARRVRSTVWVVSDLNPDGVARGTRQNAHGVDLNRNFPWRWRVQGRIGDLAYSGPRALSEPESRFAYSLIRRLRPRVTIWFHQPFGVVDASGGARAVEQRFANRVGLAVRELARYRGSASTWQDHRFRASTAFVVELPSGPLSDVAVERYARAVQLAALS